MLTKVTITGADDAVDPATLLALSVEFPFVEWGILFSSKREGMPRYPSARWQLALHVTSHAMGVYPQLAAHFCGDYARDTLIANDRWLSAATGFQRIQLNGWDGQGLARLTMRCKSEIIMQVRTETMLQTAADIASEVAPLGGRASALYDPSGGRGIEAFSWPRAPFGLSLGYAGGITPSTVLDVLRDIGPVDGDFWIDMESGVRVDNKFSVDLAREVLENAASFVRQAL